MNKQEAKLKIEKSIKSLMKPNWELKRKIQEEYLKECAISLKDFLKEYEGQWFEFICLKTDDEHVALREANIVIQDGILHSRKADIYGQFVTRQSLKFVNNCYESIKDGYVNVFKNVKVVNFKLRKRKYAKKPTQSYIESVFGTSSYEQYLEDIVLHQM